MLLLLVKCSEFSLFAGSNHSVVLSKEGRVYTFGAGNSGELGLGESVSEVETPQLVTGIKGKQTH